MTSGPFQTLGSAFLVRYGIQSIKPPSFFGGTPATCEDAVWGLTLTSAAGPARSAMRGALAAGPLPWWGGGISPPRSVPASRLTQPAEMPITALAFRNVPSGKRPENQPARLPQAIE